MNLSCTICFDFLFTGEESEMVDATQCGHVFHHECLDQWIQSSNSCPHCRQNVTTKNTIKLNIMSQQEPSSSSPSSPFVEDGRITRSTARNRNNQNNLAESELKLKNSQLDLKVRELNLKNVELQRMEKKCKAAEKNCNIAERENLKLKQEIETLKQEISKLKTDLAKEKEKSNIIRSDLRIMDIIDLESENRLTYRFSLWNQTKKFINENRSIAEGLSNDHLFSEVFLNVNLIVLCYYFIFQALFFLKLF
ncbi:E3 ubiquitin-protein ligase trul-1-like isoform X2 [Planococcus citri]|uniref:E3 ubiquitin-protein ligase trul-1-like isoform X2 n=1 Tax=Planococcus citri TaxID=170843 RepID=UPI0031F9FBCF